MDTEMACCICQAAIPSVKASYGDLNYPMCLACWHERPNEAPSSVYQPCETCNGKGVKDCPYCEGFGTCQCENCDNEHECGKCDGDKTVDCPECRGVGKIKRHAEHIPVLLEA
jgi:hypothetical protein